MDQEVFPTYVGVFPLSSMPLVVYRRLPHVRGGVSSTVLFLSSSAVSSPRTWGCFSVRWRECWLTEVFPTYVGVFLTDTDDAGYFDGLPHVRGGVSNVFREHRSPLLSSPRTWGCFL